MSVYFVMHPSNPDLRATVEAPSTEKARTVFLDYMERTGIIPRSLRTRYRRDMVAERLEEPDSVFASLHLDYDLDSGSSEFREAPYSGRVSLDGEYPITPSVDLESEGGIDTGEFIPPVRAEERSGVRSPIQELVTGGYAYDE